MSSRQNIADALNDLDGLVSASTNQPPTIAKGMAWPSLSRLEPSEAGWAWETTWEVWVILPGDDPTGRDTWFESHAVDIAEALRPVLLVESIERTSFGDLPAALFTGRSE